MIMVVSEQFLNSILESLLKLRILTDIIRTCERSSESSCVAHGFCIKGVLGTKHGLQTGVAVAVLHIFMYIYANMLVSLDTKLT